MRSVAIYGFGEKTRDLVWGTGAEIWSINWAYRYNIPRIDRLFDIHPRMLLQSEIQDYREHWVWMQEEHEFPIYTVEEFPEIPNSVAYPIEEITLDIFSHLYVGEDSDDYWTSGVSYALGMAIHENVDRIELYGVEMETDVKYQRDGVALLIGFAMGRGIDVWKPEGSGFLESKRYGFEGGQMVARSAIKEHIAHYTAERERILAELNRAAGIASKNGNADELEKLQKQLWMTDGARQSQEHLLKVADLQEVDLNLRSSFEEIKV